MTPALRRAAMRADRVSYLFETTFCHWRGKAVTNDWVWIRRITSFQYALAWLRLTRIIGFDSASLARFYQLQALLKLSEIIGFETGLLAKFYQPQALLRLSGIIGLGLKLVHWPDFTNHRPRWDWQELLGLKLVHWPSFHNRWPGKTSCHELSGLMFRRLSSDK